MKAWYFSTTNKKLRYGDDRVIEVGETHKVTGKLELCDNGLHANTNILDALLYAPGPVIWRVELAGDIIKGDNKLCASERTYLWGYDASETLQKFARLCALDVIHLWDAPEVVVQYLKTGDESLRQQAENSVAATYYYTTDAAARAAYYATYYTDAAARATTAAAATARAAEAALSELIENQTKRLYRMIMYNKP